jgi:hypothetical protein
VDADFVVGAIANSLIRRREKLMTSRSFMMDKHFSPLAITPIFKTRQFPDMFESTIRHLLNSTYLPDGFIAPKRCPGLTYHAHSGLSK